MAFRKIIYSSSINGLENIKQYSKVCLASPNRLREVANLLNHQYDESQVPGMPSVYLISGLLLTLESRSPTEIDSIRIIGEAENTDLQDLENLADCLGLPYHA